MDDFPDYPCRGCGNRSCRNIGWQKCLRFRVWFGRWWGVVRRNAAELKKENKEHENTDSL